MIKRNKWNLLFSSLVILLPMLLGIFGENLLPDSFPIHWGFDGTADGFSDSPAIFFILPPIFLAIHWLCMLLTVVIDKNAVKNQKLLGISLWIIPVISLSSCGMIFSIALGHTANIFNLILLLLAVAFIVIGNYMPKTVRNRTMGIKIKWALANDENWNATHRFAGKIYVITGFVCLLMIPLPLPSSVFPYLAIGILLPCVLLPILYSYYFYKKQIAEGKATKEDYERGSADLWKNKKLAMAILIPLLSILIIALAIVMFTGKIETTLGDDSLEVKASFHADLSVKYEDIDAVEFRDHAVDGERLWGFGSARLLLGTFENEELGTYTRYTYTGDHPCVILTVGDKTLVISTGDAESTKEIYERILCEIAE